MAKRDPISEILRKRSRSRKKTDRWNAYYERSSTLYDSIEFLQKQESDKAIVDELARYIPVALVAGLEAYIRIVIKDLINYGKPYRQNARALSEVRIDLPMVLGIQGARISMGEFLSHLLRLSSMEDINRHLSTLIGADFFASVKSTPYLESGKTLEQTDSAIWRDISNVFERRHVICHENVQLKRYGSADARRDYFATLGFSLATDTLLDRLMPARVK